MKDCRIFSSISLAEFARGCQAGRGKRRGGRFFGLRTAHGNEMVRGENTQQVANLPYQENATAATETDYGTSRLR
jgi:hypothetical protein